jgi:hypothetical protein
VLPGYSDDKNWRYSYIQGLETKTNKYEGKIVDILLYTKEQGHSPVAVGILRGAYVLSKNEAIWASNQFAAKKWLGTMRAEVESLGGNVDALPAVPSNRNNVSFPFINIRFTPESLHFFDDPRLIDLKATYYVAQNWDGKIPEEKSKFQGIKVSKTVKARKKSLEEQLEDLSGEVRFCREQAGKIITPRQIPIQKALAQQLYEMFYPEMEVFCEKDRVDITLESPKETIFIEIKPEDTARRSIRLAIGQLLEYSHYPNAEKAKSLIIVGDEKETREDKQYLQFLKDKYGLPLKYIYWPKGTEKLPDAVLRRIVP